LKGGKGDNDDDDDDDDDSGKSKGKGKGSNASKSKGSKSKGSKSKRSKSKLKDQSTTVIQTAWRRYSAGLSYNSDLLSVVMIQCLVRCTKAKMIAKQKRQRHRLHEDLELLMAKLVYEVDLKTMHFTAFLALLSKELGGIDLTSEKDFIKNTLSVIITNMEDKEGGDDEVEVVDVSMEDKEDGDDEDDEVKVVDVSMEDKEDGDDEVQVVDVSMENREGGDDEVEVVDVSMEDKEDGDDEDDEVKEGSKDPKVPKDVAKGAESSSHNSNAIPKDDLPKPGTFTTKGDSTPSPDVRRPKNAASNPENDLCDTPNQESNTTANVSGTKKKKRLRQTGGGRKFGRVEMDNVTCSSSGHGSNKKNEFDRQCDEKWTEEEAKKEEYGVARTMLRQYKVEKSNVENMKLVQSTYTALEDVMDFQFQGHNATAEEVANAISGVPMWKETLMEKRALGEWFETKILCPPEQIPSDCQYHFLAINADSRGMSQRMRSAMLYDRKMKEEVKPMEFVQCSVHSDEAAPWMKMSK
jgi:hypothetical protein